LEKPLSGKLYQIEQANNGQIFWEQVNQIVKLRLSHSTKATYDCGRLTLDLKLGL